MRQRQEIQEMLRQIEFQEMRIRDENEYLVRWSSTQYAELKQKLAFEPLLHGVYRVKPKGDMEYKEHAHHDFEIIIPLSPTYKCALNKEYVEIRHGELLMVQTGDIHKDIFQKESEYLALTFELKPGGSFLPDPQLFKKNMKAHSRSVKFIQDEFSHRMLELLKAFPDREPPYDYYISDGLFKAFFWKTISLFPKGCLRPFFMKSVRNEEFKASLTLVFEACADTTTSVAKIAKQMGMSESSLAHKTKETLGISPAKAFSNYKMEKAMMMLRGTNLSIKEISISLGFKDQFHFSKAFKKRFNIPPSSAR